MKTKIKLFRILDYWLGIPLCALFSPFAIISRKWQSLLNQKPSSPKKILVIKLVEIGAVIHAYHFFQKLHEEHPLAKVYILTFSKNKEIFELFKDFSSIEQIITIEEDNPFLLLKDVLKTLLWLSYNKMDIAFDLEFFVRASALLTFFSGARTTIGFYAYGFEGLYRGNFLTHKVSYNPLAHVTVNYLSLFLALNKPYKNSPEVDHYIDKSSLVFPTYASKPDVLKSVEDFIPKNKKIFLMNLGEGNIPLREWPLMNFKEVAEKILEDHQNVLLLVGTKDACAKAEELMKGLKNDRLKNYCGETTLKQLMEIFLLSEALIANDGGLGHLAMLTPVKKFILLGPETPQVFSPLGPHTHIFYSHWPCSPCLSALNHRNSFCQDNKCLKAIQPKEVIETIKKFCPSSHPNL